MPGYVQLILLIVFFYLAYRLFFFGPPQFMLSTKPCENCDGKGHWYGMRHREDCKVCDGTGKVPK